MVLCEKIIENNIFHRNIFANKTQNIDVFRIKLFMEFIVRTIIFKKQEGKVYLIMNQFTAWDIIVLFNFILEFNPMILLLNLD